jgi:hypothetical protein
MGRDRNPTDVGAKEKSPRSLTIGGIGVRDSEEDMWNEVFKWFACIKRAPTNAMTESVELTST